MQDWDRRKYCYYHRVPSLQKEREDEGELQSMMGYGFGMPHAVMLDDGSIMAAYWCTEGSITHIRWCNFDHR
jgi:hypothetical protein